jgi:hypothetical protein
MRSNKRIIISLGFVFLLLVIASYILWPIALELYSDQVAYETRIAYRDDYTLHTTPLAESVVQDVCLKLGILESNEHCQPGVMVYAPDLFDEIKMYFVNLPGPNKTYEVVQDKLGAYLDYCEKPNPDGNRRCRYDLRGDDLYPVFFYFDKNDLYYRIIANTGGS